MHPSSDDGRLPHAARRPSIYGTSQPTVTTSHILEYPRVSPSCPHKTLGLDWENKLRYTRVHRGRQRDKQRASRSRKGRARKAGGCSGSATDLCLSVYTVIQGFAELTLPPTALPSHHHSPHRPSLSPSLPSRSPFPRAICARPRPTARLSPSAASCGRPALAPARARLPLSPDAPSVPFPSAILAPSASWALPST